jgi:hypothetical protein
MLSLLLLMNFPESSERKDIHDESIFHCNNILRRLLIIFRILVHFTTVYQLDVLTYLGCNFKSFSFLLVPMARDDKSDDKSEFNPLPFVKTLQSTSNGCIPRITVPCPFLKYLIEFQ